MKRNLLATLIFSQGVPMLLGGDEMGRTQRGNNNAYARTTRSAGSTGTSTPDDRELLEFTRRVFGVFRDNPVLRRRSLLHGPARWRATAARRTSPGCGPTAAR